MTSLDLPRLRSCLDDAGYHVDEVLDAIGEAGQSGLGRNSTVAADRALTGRDDPLSTLVRLWILQQDVPRPALERALPAQLDGLLDAGLIDVEADRARALVDVRPYASEDDGASGWVVSDLTPALDHSPHRARPDHVLGVSGASTTLAQLVLRRPVGSALDLGTGCGVQSLHLARHADRVVATDLNPRTLELARITLGLSGVDADLRLGDLYEPVADERFDLIVTNPPFVMAPPGDRPLVYRESGLTGDELMRRVVTRAPERLTDGGLLQVLGNWAHVTGEPWQDRLASWIEPTGCAALVLEREVLDPFEYVEIWLADAGLAGRPGYRAAYDAWLDYFDRLGVEAVGMGWIALQRGGSGVRIESWPHAVQQPVGEAFGDYFDSLNAVAMTPQEQAARCWRHADDLVQETIGDPGAEDPRHIVLRRQTGFRRAIEASTLTAAVVGACDGELPLYALVTGAASLLSRGFDEAWSEFSVVLPDLIRDDFLRLS